MTDDDIDTSDIPQLDDVFFATAKWRLPRIQIYLTDLKEARNYALYILRKNLYEKKTPLRELFFMAFHTSLIISYARPFHDSKGFWGQPKASLKNHLDEVLDEAEMGLHKRVLEMRDTAYAHSDSRSHLYETFDYTKGVGFMRVVETLDRTETILLKKIINKWISYLANEKLELKRSLENPR